jgi:Periplasmic protein TonB, links inner and outer membranes
MVFALSPLFLTSVNAEDSTPSTSVTDLGTFTDPTASSLNSVLDYGVFTMNCTAGNHMEANIAAYMATAVSNTGISANTDWTVTDASSINYIHSIAENGSWTSANSTTKQSNMIFGDSIIFDRTYNNGNGITLKSASGTVYASFNGVSQLNAKQIYHKSETTYTIDFTSAFAGLQLYSSAQYTKSDTGVSIDRKENTITITCEEGDDIVNLSTTDLSKNIDVIGNGTTNYSLIINITDASGDLKLSSPITVNGSREGYSKESSHVLINFGTSYTGTVTFGEFNMGSILAPNANVIIESTHNGSVFAASVHNTNGEIHQSHFTTVGAAQPKEETPKEETPKEETPKEETITPTNPKNDTEQPTEKSTTTEETPKSDETTAETKTTESTDRTVTPVVTDSVKENTIVAQTTSSEETVSTSEQTTVTERPSTPDTGAGNEIKMAFGLLAASMIVISSIVIYRKKCVD